MGKRQREVRQRKLLELSLCNNQRANGKNQMQKFIIENRSQLKDDTVLLLVADIICEGRTDKGGLEFPRHRVYVKRYDFTSRRNKRSDRFLVTDL